MMANLYLPWNSRVQRRTSRCSLDAESLEWTEEEGEEGNKPIISFIFKNKPTNSST